MLKIKTKLKFPLLLIPISLSGFFLYQYLTFIPEYSSATEISTPILDDSNVEKRTLADITYMQDMTPEICANTPESTAAEDHQKQLIDSRDGKTYWVSKLADGNCWMTQNLDLDLNGVTLTPDDSNVSVNWVSTTGASTTNEYNYSNSYLARYYDPGYAYYTDNTSTTTTKNDLDNTTGEQWSKDISGKEETHYMQGNLYSWTAATAGSGDSSVTSGNASDSICPKGWQLPTSNNTDAVQKSFGGLTTAYGIANSSAGSTAMRSAPRYFIYGGNVFNSSFSSAGSSGNYWSSTASSRTYAYNLYLYSNTANPSSGNFRYVGYSVRCVATGTATPVDPEIVMPNPNISVTVPSIITLDVYSENEDSDTVDININNSDTGEGSFIAKVSSNSAYNLSLSTIENGHTDLKNDKANSSIPALSTTPPIITTDDKSWWGIKCINSTNCIKTEYTGLTTSTVPYFSSTAGGANQLTDFTIGIKTNPDLPSGTYSTSILVTASQN